MKQIKKILHKIFRISGRDFLPYTYDNFYSLRRSKILANETINLVLDIGANKGTYSHELRENGYSGRVISFEPLYEPFQILKKESEHDPLWDCEQIALGDSIGETTINVSEHITSSSILHISDRHTTACPSSNTVGTEKINVSTVDSLREKYFRSDDRILMKIDVQGYEKHVLDGARLSLEQTCVIEIELSLVEMYECGPLLKDMLVFLEQLGFTLVAINPVFSDPATGYMLQVDGILTRK